jgi:L-seryl-tRNA(Ser) seleniumtransferase
MKVGKEEMAGLLAAVKRYVAIDHEERRERDERVVAGWRAAFNDLPGVRTQRSFPNEAGQPLPRCEVTLSSGAKLSRDALVDALWNSNPRISVQIADSDSLLFNPMTLTDEEVRFVEARLLALLA